MHKELNFTSDEHHQAKLYWTDEGIVDGDNPLQLGANNFGKSVGGSTVHFAMVSLRFRPEWFKARSLLGYGVDWPLDWREMWSYYAEVEQALKISGPINYPWGPKRPRYPYRPHELNAAALVLAQGCEALGVDWTETPLATVSAPRGHSPPCVYRGMCVIGCSTNAKQSVLITWLPRALDHGAVAEVPIEIPAPERPGRYALKFDLVSEGIDWFERCGSPTTTRALWVR